MTPRRRGPELAGVRYRAFGDGALLITLGEDIDIELNRSVHRLAAAIDDLRAGGQPFGRPVPGYASILVPFDPIELDFDRAQSAIEPLVATMGRPVAPVEPSERTPPVAIPVRYGGDAGPDLDDVAMLNGLRPRDVIELHSGATYHVFMLGFAPGFAYLGALPPSIATPRLATPRQRVPAGSVAIAGAQTAVYPFASPGGWRLIGRTEMPMWDLARSSPAALSPGDLVRFVPID